MARKDRCSPFPDFSHALVIMFTWWSRCDHWILLSLPFFCFANPYSKMSEIVSGQQSLASSPPPSCKPRTKLVLHKLVKLLGSNEVGSIKNDYMIGIASQGVQYLGLWGSAWGTWGCRGQKHISQGELFLTWDTSTCLRSEKPWVDSKSCLCWTVCSESRQCTLGPAHVETRAHGRDQCSPANRTVPKACTGELGAEKGLFFVATLDVMWIGNSFPVWMVGVMWCLQTCRVEEGEQLPHTKGPAFLCSRNDRITELCWNTGFIFSWLNTEASWRIGGHSWWRTFCLPLVLRTA